MSTDNLWKSLNKWEEEILKGKALQYKAKISLTIDIFYARLYMNYSRERAKLSSQRSEADSQMHITSTAGATPHMQTQKEGTQKQKVRIPSAPAPVCTNCDTVLPNVTGKTCPSCNSPLDTRTVLLSCGPRIDLSFRVLSVPSGSFPGLNRRKH